MNSDRKWDKGIVIGAGVSGLVSAHSLSKYFDNVIIYDKEKQEEFGMSPRKSIPQGNHIHILLTAAVKSLNNRFPALFDNLTKEGSKSYQVSEGVKWYHYGN